MRKLNFTLVFLFISAVFLETQFFVLKVNALTTATSSLATSTIAQSTLSYAGWIPFWKQASGASDTALNLDKLNAVSPFSFEVKANGSLVDRLQINSGFWPTWLSAARELDVDILPTIAWFDGQGIHKLLSNKTKRITHENNILKLVKKNNFDGIDIDYESKLAITKDYFSTFLYGLALRLHPINKKLVCTIETRMPIDSRLIVNNTPADYAYANDYASLNKYCDEIRLMAYDQGIIDAKLDASKGNGNIYAPVADPDWVEKVLNQAIPTIKPQKIILGIPTYGYEYEVSWNNGTSIYKRIRSYTYVQAMQKAADIGATPSRNIAGELSFTYATTSVAKGIPQTLTWNISSPNQPPEIAANSSAGKSTRFVTFTDSQSIGDKISLAQKLGLAGVVFFKLDGEQDPLMWSQVGN